MIRERRVLHVVGRMDRGGVETWLVHVLRHLDRRQVRMDFLVHANERCALDSEVESLGGRVIRSPESASQPWRYVRAFRKVLTVHGPYDAVHSHVHDFSGLLLREAHHLRVPVRIAHSHIDTRTLDSVAGVKRRLYLTVMRRWIRRYATVGLSASRLAAQSLYGPRWREDARWEILHYGIDLRPFSHPVERVGVRAALGLGPDAFVIGHVGRFDAQKNHAFLLDIAGVLIAADPAARLLLVGDGGLKSAAERKALALKIADKVVMTGVRDDVPRLMIGAMDCFVLPSLYEGLPVVLVEAQAAGLPCIVADTVSDEADMVPGLVSRVGLSQPASSWTDVILAVRGRRMPASEAVRFLQGTSFSVEASAGRLLEIYLS